MVDDRRRLLSVRAERNGCQGALKFEVLPPATNFEPEQTVCMMLWQCDEGALPCVGALSAGRESARSKEPATHVEECGSDLCEGDHLDRTQILIGKYWILCLGA